MPFLLGKACLEESFYQLCSKLYTDDARAQAQHIDDVNRISIVVWKFLRFHPLSNPHIIKRTEFPVSIDSIVCILPPTTL
jgi:hypothetical protein